MDDDELAELLGPVLKAGASKLGGPMLTTLVRNNLPAFRKLRDNGFTFKQIATYLENQGLTDRQKKAPSAAVLMETFRKANRDAGAASATPRIEPRAKSAAAAAKPQATAPVSAPTPTPTPDIAADKVIHPAVEKLNDVMADAEMQKEKIDRLAKRRFR